MEMKLKMKLAETVHKVKEAGMSDTLVYKPTLNPYDEYVKFSVSGPLVEELTNALGIPTNIGDTMIVEMISKEEQTKLEEAGESGKKKGSGTDKAGK